jgi:hypothetical protein
MNKCCTYKFKCPYALSSTSSLPCFATNDQCRDWVQKFPTTRTTTNETIEEIKLKKVNNAIQELEVVEE